MRTSYHEGRCTQCGQRVTVERATRHHRSLDGQPCGPVETHHPGGATNESMGEHWVVPKGHGST
jgi:hypothetical protein